MEKTDASSGHMEKGTGKQGAVALPICQFAAICRRTTAADAKTGKPADTTSEADLALLLSHADAGGVISIAMAAWTSSPGGAT